MTALADKVVADTLGKVQVVYLDRETSKWWNGRRKGDDTAVFCGWFWVKGSEEAGPFKTRSSAIRDAYYTFILKRELPSVGHSMVEGMRHRDERQDRQDRQTRRKRAETRQAA